MPGQRLAFLQPIEMRMNEMISGVARRPGGEAVRRRPRRAGRPRAHEIEAILEHDSRQRPTSASSRSPASRCCRSSSNQEQLARYGVPAKVVTDIDRIDRQQAAGRSDRRPAAVSARGSAAGRQCGAAPEAIGSILMPTAVGRAIAAVAAGRHRDGRRAVDDHPRVGPAADHGHGQRPRPRHRQLRGRGPAADRRSKLALPPGRYFYRIRRPVRASAAGPHAAADRRAAGRAC